MEHARTMGDRDLLSGAPRRPSRATPVGARLSLEGRELDPPADTQHLAIS